MALVPLDIAPGFSSSATAYATGMRWRQGNLIRWHGGIMQPIGGWVRLNTTQMTGDVRALFGWRENDYQRRLAIGTISKLYIYSDGTIYDITPADLVAGYADSDPENNIAATTWTFGNFGEWLLGVQDRDGRMFVWQNNTSNPATVVTDAPTNLLGVHVTPERHVFAIGAGGDKRKISWCSAENINDWTPSSTNSAGYMNLATNEVIKGWIQFRNLTLVFTESEVHAVRYVGYPYFYGVEKVSSGGGIMGPHAAVALDDKVVWMGPSNFFMFDGALRHLPCDVSEAVFGDINKDQREKIYAGRNRQFNEVWWFYPGANNPNNTKYVVWNYAMNIWYTGEINRAATEDNGIFEYPIAATVDGFLYEHENGWTDNGSEIGQSRWARSGMLTIGDGNNIVFVRRAIPDRDPSTAFGIRLRTAEWPESEATQSTKLQTASPKMDFRISGRHVQIELVGLKDEAWQFGRLRLDVVPAGGR